MPLDALPPHRSRWPQPSEGTSRSIRGSKQRSRMAQGRRQRPSTTGRSSPILSTSHGQPPSLLHGQPDAHHRPCGAAHPQESAHTRRHSEGPVEAAGAVDARTDARPQAPWTPANERRRPQLPQAALQGIHTEAERRKQVSLNPPSTPYGLNLWTALRSAPVRRRPQVSVGGTALLTRSPERT